MNRSILRLFGFLFWGAVLVVSVAAMRLDRDSTTNSLSSTLGSYFLGPNDRVSLTDRTRQLREHDPVFYRDTNGDWSQVGHVETTSLASGNQQGTVTVSWYSADVSPQLCNFTMYRNRGRLEDVVATMLPPEKRLQIQQRLASAMNEHGDELSAAFVPLVQATLKRSLPIIEDELSLAVQRHRPEIQALGQRWNDEVVNQRLIPLAQREIVPIVREHGEPTAESIGRELWDRASLWRFGWRAVYDKSPLPRKDLLQEEWDRFVDQEALPVFESHMDEIVTTVQRIVADVAANETVRREMTDVATRIATDRETQQLVSVILRETLVDNERLREAWASVWSSQEARQALDMAGDRLEPVVRQIGDDLFGSQEEGIHPNFARVLRSQILGKDRRWIVATSTEWVDTSVHPTIAVSDEPMPYPVVYLADRHKEDSASSLGKATRVPDIKIPESLPSGDVGE